MKFKQLSIAAISLTLTAASPLFAQSGALSGFKTIGPNGDYKTLTEAAEALVSMGINGPVTFQIEGGTYNEQVVFNSVAGASKDNTITFEAMDGEEVIVTSDTRSSVENYAANLASASAIITLDNADYFTFSGLNFITPQNGPLDIFLLKNGAEYCTIIDCNLESATKGSNDWSGNDFYPICLPTVNGLPNHHFALINSRIVGGNNQIYALNRDTYDIMDGIEVRGCSFDDSAGGISLSRVANATIADNSFYSTLVGNYVAIAMTNTAESFNITGNTLNYNVVESYSASYGPTMIDATAGVGAEGFIANNTCYIVNGGAYSSAFLKMQTANYGKLTVANNTAVLDEQGEMYGGANNSSIVYFGNARMDNLTFSNNLFINKGNGSVYRSFLAGASAVTGMTFINNAYSYSGNNFYQYSYDRTFMGFDDWKVMYSTDAASLTGKFDTDETCRPDNATFEAIAGKGVAVDGLLTDIEGTSRSTTPTIGAYEYVLSPMHGEYTIGAGGNFADFNAAIKAMQERTISGPVEFNVLPGVYKERIEIANIAGASTDNTITFAGEEGNFEAVVITYDKYEEDLPDYNSNWAGMRGVVTVNGVAGVTFRDISVISEASGPINAVLLRDGANDFTMEGCHVANEFFMGQLGDYNTTNVRIIYLADALPNNRITLTNCVFSDANNGILLSNANYTCSDGLTIRGCSFEGQCTPIAMRYTDNVTIEQNTMYFSRPATPQNVWPYKGIWINGSYGNVNINGNIILADVDATTIYIGRPILEVYGIKLTSFSGTNYISNNYINITDKGDGEAEAICIDNFSSSWDGDVTVAHNTCFINCDYESNTKACVVKFEKSVYKNLTVANNIFQNTGYGVIYLSNHATLTGVQALTNNYPACYNTLSRATASFGKLNNTYVDFDGWNNASGNSETPVFHDVELDEDGRPSSESNKQLAFMGTKLDAITTDIEGNERHSENPTIGAFENRELTGIASLEAEQTQIHVIDKTIVLHGFEGISINVYSISGALVESFTPVSDIYYHTSTLPAGIYIIVAGEYSSKITL